MKRTSITLFGITTFVATALGACAIAQDAAPSQDVAEDRSLWADLSGTWIRYEHDMIITHRIVNNQDVSQMHSQYGELWQGFIADVQLGLDDGNRTYRATNAKRTHPVGGSEVPSEFVANYILRGDHLFFMRGVYDKTVNPMIHELRRASQPQDHLLVAARAGDIKTVAKLLASGVEVDGLVPGSYTALAYAASFGHLDLIDFLLEHGAKVTTRGRWRKTPLLHAAGSGYVDACKALVKAGANPEDVNWGRHNCVFETCYWGQPKTLDYFLSLGSDVNSTKPSGHTPLHHAVLRLRRNAREENNARLVECLKVLLKHGADKTIENGDGETASQLAAARGYPEVAKMLQ